MNILEKALAKLHGTYRALDAGSSSSTTPSQDAAKTSSAAVMAMLSGGVATREHMKDREIDGPALFATAQRLMDNGGGGMTLSCSGANARQKRKLGLVPQHAYSVIDAAGGPPERCVWSGGRSFLRLRNPWGEKAWEGAWGAGSDLWQKHPHVRQKLLSSGVDHTLRRGLSGGGSNLSRARRNILPSKRSEQQQEHEMLEQEKDDGSFWMELTDVVEYFAAPEWCWSAPHVHHKVLRGRWDADTAGGHDVLPSWEDNPHFLLSVQVTSLVLITVAPTDRRFALDDLTLSNIGLHLLPDEEGPAMPRETYPLECHRAQCLAVRDNVRTARYWGTLQPGKYWLVPDAFEAGAQGGFVIQAASPAPYSLQFKTKAEYWRTLSATAIVDEPYGNPKRVSGVPRMVFKVRKRPRAASQICQIRARMRCEDLSKEEQKQLSVQLHLCHGLHTAAENGMLRQSSVLSSSQFLRSTTVDLSCKFDIASASLRGEERDDVLSFTVLAKPVLRCPSPGKARRGEPFRTVKVTVTVDCTDVDGCGRKLSVRAPCTDPCVMCDEPVLEDRISTIEGQTVHSSESDMDCMQAYREAQADKCLVCGGPILGRFYKTDEGKVHAEEEGDCYQQYREAKADKCVVCGGPILGRYFDADEGVKVHAQEESGCHQRYLEARAPRCIVCAGPVLGKYYDMKEAGGVIHGEDDTDCMARWKDMRGRT